MGIHADTTVAGKNYAVLQYTDRICDVAPFSNNYTLMKGFSIVSSATGYTSENGRKYILVSNEAFYIPGMEHTIINPNQCHHFGSDVQDNPYHDKEPMAITIPGE